MFDYITGLIEQTGYLGIALLMLAENVFPPIPSELIMPLAGFSAASGDLNIALVIVAGTVGTVLGATLWYYVGKWVGLERLERWAERNGRLLTLKPDEVEKADDWFDRHGRKAVFFGRFVPAVRTLISVPAGISGMALMPFLLFTTLGSAIWVGALAAAGYFLEDQYRAVSGWVNPVSNVIIAILVAWYLYRVVTFRR